MGSCHCKSSGSTAPMCNRTSSLLMYPHPCRRVKMVLGTCVINPFFNAQKEWSYSENYDPCRASQPLKPWEWVTQHPLGGHPADFEDQLIIHWGGAFELKVLGSVLPVLHVLFRFSKLHSINLCSWHLIDCGFCINVGPHELPVLPVSLEIPLSLLPTLWPCSSGL